MAGQLVGGSVDAPATPAEQRAAKIKAMLWEQEGYRRRGLKDRVKYLDDLLALEGYVEGEFDLPPQPEAPANPHVTVDGEPEGEPVEQAVVKDDAEQPEKPEKKSRSK